MKIIKLNFVIPLFLFLLSIQWENISFADNPEQTKTYVGSSACRNCHPGEYNYWSWTPHSYMTKLPEKERQIGIRILDSKDFPFPKENISLILGNLKKQVYLAKKGSDYYFLPKQYNIVTGKWEAFQIDEWEPSLFENEGVNSQTAVTWNSRCAGCHTTGYDPIKKTFVEISIGCEECHGPGSLHAKTTMKDYIVNPKSLSPKRAIDVCAQCHARGIEKRGKYPFPSKFVPGDDLSNFMTFIKPKIGSNNEFFWGNGMAKKHHQQYQEFTQSKHYEMGLSCLDCHEGHRIKLLRPISSKGKLLVKTERVFLASKTHSICVKCHVLGESNFVTDTQPSEKEQKIIEQHSKHPILIKKKGYQEDHRSTPLWSYGKLLCNDCHMPKTSPENISYDMHSHTFRSPRPGDTVLYGVPNACNGCHTDKSPEWAKEKIHEIWLEDRPQSARWEKFLDNFKKGEKEWVYIQKFMSDAPRDAKVSLESVSREFDSIKNFVDSSLKEIKKESKKLNASKSFPLSLMDRVTEKESEIEDLIMKLETFKKEKFLELSSIIDTKALQALNKVLGVNHYPEKRIPQIEETFLKTQQKYKIFNEKVSQEGKSFFEGQNKKTKWDDWIKIYSGLNQGKLNYADYKDYVDELSEMGLIEYTIRLK